MHTWCSNELSDVLADTFFRLESTCPGDTLTFQCTITGSSGHATVTVWNGSAFECAESSNDISLLHSRFNTSFTGYCNNGSIVGQSLYAEDNDYTSKLTITITSNMTGKTIQCNYDNGTSVRLIGCYTINYSEDSVCANLSVGINEPTPIVSGTRIKIL